MGLASPRAQQWLMTSCARRWISGLPRCTESKSRAAVLVPAAMELAQTIAAKSPIGLRLGKESINKAEFMPVEEGYAMEQTYSTRLLQTEDAREATRAAVEKRAPVFKGR